MVNSRSWVRNSRGALLIPCALMAMIIALTGFGIWSCLRSWRKQVDIQLTLDQCVGKKALELKSLLGNLSGSNTRMKIVRASATVGSLTPYTMAAIQAELAVELALQEGMRIRWWSKMATSIAGKACADIQAHAIAFPTLSWNRLPPDQLGPQPFDWPESDPKFDLTFVTRSKHYSSARVEGDPHGKQEWLAHWADGLQSIGTNFR